MYMILLCYFCVSNKWNIFSNVFTVNLQYYEEVHGLLQNVVPCLQY